MTKLRVRDRVRVEGNDEVFAVFYVNPAATWADLACIERVGFLTYVPIEEIRHVDAREEDVPGGSGECDSP